MGNLRNQRGSIAFAVVLIILVIGLLTVILIQNYMATENRHKEVRLYQNGFLVKVVADSLQSLLQEGEVLTVERLRTAVDERYPEMQDPYTKDASEIVEDWPIYYGLIGFCAADLFIHEDGSSSGPENIISVYGRNGVVIVTLKSESSGAGDLWGG